MNSTSDKPVRYLTVSELYNINHEITDGDTFVRDVHLLESAAKRPSLVIFGEAQFPTLVDKAAALMHSLAYHHLFADGNKRTAVVAVSEFFRLNGWHIQWPPGKTEAFVLDVAQQRCDIPQIAAWLGRYAVPRDG